MEKQERMQYTIEPNRNSVYKFYGTVEKQSSHDPIEYYNFNPINPKCPINPNPHVKPNRLSKLSRL